MAALQYWVWLSELNGVNHVSKLKLLQHFGSPEDIYYAAPEDYGQVEGISREQIELLGQKSLQRAEWILQECARENIFLVTMDDVLQLELLGQEETQRDCFIHAPCHIMIQIIVNFFIG